ncbi:MAG: cytochrome c oxidase subunit 3 [Deltaproteobacteria bacterium]|nr:cytochrome c oxidase subunit 3 [Deltaproteobacteria bacterium]
MSTPALALGAPKRAGKLPTPVLGMLILVVAESMMFAGMVSAFTIVRGQIPGGIWPPAGQPRLPFESTMLNTAALVASGVSFWISRELFTKNPERSKKLFLLTIVLGSLFLGLQGVEWVRLIAQGLTAKSSVHGGFFYLIVGAHGLHVLAAVIVLLWAFWKLRANRLGEATFSGVRVLWSFVVALWPFLYLRVYL